MDIIQQLTTQFGLQRWQVENTVKLIDEGKLSKEIANYLSISINTVNRHRQNIFEKLNVDHAIEACKVARVMGLI